uniref:Sorcin n=1 Tax=Taeniopygia guttata TaxID=59729 RepID=H0YT53_TAEGU
ADGRSPLAPPGRQRDAGSGKGRGWKSPPSLRIRVVAPGRSRAGGAGARRRWRTPGSRRPAGSTRAGRSSRRTSIPWTSSGSFVWLFCCSRRAGKDGQIDADELQRCLTQSGIAGAYKPFNLETCRLMISMLDRDMSGTLGFNEFKELWAVVNGWKQHFVSFDSDGSGTVDRQELEKALMNMGFRLSPQAVTAITKRYSTQGKIAFDDYIACCVKLRALTECFRRRDVTQQGFVNFHYDDFIQCVMSI